MRAKAILLAASLIAAFPEAAPPSAAASQAVAPVELSKRHGATAVSQYREEGLLSETLLNYLVLLGWTSPSGEEVLPMERVAQDFSLQGLSKSAPIHSRKKLEWLNSLYIRKEDGESLLGLLLPYVEKAGLSTDHIDHPTLVRMVGVLKENLVVLSQVEEYLGIFFDEKFSFEEGARAIVMDPIHRETAETLLHKLIEQNDPRHVPAGYILAAMLERKRILKVKEQIVRDGKRTFIYAQPKTGDVFTITDPDLKLDQLEEVQRDVAAATPDPLPQSHPGRETH